MSNKTPINNAAGAPSAIGPYSQAMRVGELVFLSGQLGMDENGELAEGFEAQTRQIFANLQAVCSAAGGSLQQVIKLNVYLTDLSKFAVFNDIAAEFLQQPYPARAAIGAASLPKDGLVEIEGILQLTDS